MKNRAFTLIELLAVIVILAIIALIATPIVINIIKDAREKSNDRSIEAYAVAVKDAVARYAMKNPNEKIYGEFKTLEEEDGRILRRRNDRVDNEHPGVLTIDYTGAKVSCDEIDITEQGEITLNKCKVNGKVLIQSNNTTPETQTPTRYYWFSNNEGIASDGIPDGADEYLSNIDTEGNPFYLAFDTSDGTTIDGIYVCFTRDTEYCLRTALPEWGTSTICDDPVLDDETGEETGECNSEVYEETYIVTPSPDQNPYYEDNIDTLDEAFDNCSLDDGYYYCDTDGLSVYSYSYGYIYVDNGNSCSISSDGFFECHVN